MPPSDPLEGATHRLRDRHSTTLPRGLSRIWAIAVFYFKGYQCMNALTKGRQAMFKTGLIAIACRGAAIGLALAGAPVVVSAAVVIQDEVAVLAGQIASAIIQAQNEAAAAGLSQDDAAAAIEAAIQATIANSGVGPDVAAQALSSARATLAASGQLSPAAAAAVSSVQATVSGTGGGAAGSGGANGGAPLGAPGSAGGGGGGGSDYRPAT